MRLPPLTSIMALSIILQQPAATCRQQIGTSDDMEANASTFLKEMKETAYIIDAVGACAGTSASGATATGAAGATGTLISRGAASAAPSKGPRVLVIVDELGRG